MGLTRADFDNTHEHSRVRNVIYLSKLQLAMLSILVADCKMNFITDWSQLSWYTLENRVWGEVCDLSIKITFSYLGGSYSDDFA